MLGSTNETSRTETMTMLATLTHPNEEQERAAQEIAAANPEWRWSAPRRELSLGSGYAVEMTNDGRWVAYSNGFMLMNGLVAWLFVSPCAAIEGMGFTLAE